MPLNSDRIKTRMTENKRQLMIFYVNRYKPTNERFLKNNIIPLRHSVLKFAAIRLVYLRIAVGNRDIFVVTRSATLDNNVNHANNYEKKWNAKTNAND